MASRDTDCCNYVPPIARTGRRSAIIDTAGQNYSKTGRATAAVIPEDGREFATDVSLTAVRQYNYSKPYEPPVTPRPSVLARHRWTALRTGSRGARASLRRDHSGCSILGGYSPVGISM
ncbi:hypothetical protein GCU68_09195 [Natronorubrum aibiense]|uniref:Uncharacterized protein n=1 Tax=Natronorubrum aibiense TaxID=348826 RepID=A0A5P9P3F0_9EURY|nr:hypothetical protein GCU68_09195 [Natronorubrum aibiense]